ncbi:MAG TPA: hypothetical protein VGM90_17090 [Kofleriaceae bacterium]|jgi:hypothetical protein
MKIRIALVLLALAAGCSKDEPKGPPPPPPDPNAKNYSSLYDRARDGDLGMMELYYSELPVAERAKTAAPQVAPAVIAKWDKIVDEAKRIARETGTDRARGKDNRLGLADDIKMLDELSAQAPELAAKWAPLKTELASLEQTAYTDEHDDKRPRVTLWTLATDRPSPNELLAIDVFECVQGALEKKWPAFKFVDEYHRVDGPSLELVALSREDEYRSTTGETMKMTAGGAIALRPHELAAPLDKAFAKDLVAQASVANPQEIKSDLNVRPTMEASKAGLHAIDATRGQLCAGVEKELAAR